MRIVQLTTDNREQQNDYGNPLPHFGAAPTALLEGFSQLPGVEVHVVACLRRDIPSPERVFGNIRYHPVLVPKIGWMNTLYQGCIRAVRRTLHEIAPDVVHGQGTERDCAMSAVHSGLPNVLTIHGNMAELHRLGIEFQTAPLYGFLASRLETHALRRTRGVFCNSAYTESLVAPRARRTWRVPNAIRAEFFRPRDEAPPDPGEPLILNVGHLGVRKRQLEILRMARGLHQAGHRFRLVFTGSLHSADEYARTFVEELRRAEREGFASHAGFLDADALIRLMDEARGFVHFPSEEAFGLVVAEAMARGLKFFGARLGGIREIAEGVAGAELPEDFGGLKRSLARWLEDGAARVPEATATIRERYGPEAVARRHLEIYREVHHS